MSRFDEFFSQRQAAGGFSTEDTLAAILPLMRQVIETHRGGEVAPLAGLDALRVDDGKIWFEEARAVEPRNQLDAVRRLQQPDRRAVEVLGESRRTTDIDEGREESVDLRIGRRGEAPAGPVYLPGYVSWEHELGHHDPLTDVFSLGLILASLSCGLDLNVPDELQNFVAHRDNLFAINAGLHPVLARAASRMTELDRHRRPQDLATVLRTLENYRDQPVDLALDPLLGQGFPRRDPRDRRRLVLGRLQERLFDLSRRNRLLHFRPTAHSVNLTHASVPLSFDVRNIRPDQILTWGEAFERDIVAGKPVSLNKYLNFAEAVYLPSVLDQIRLEARRDQTEFGFAQLRLVLCFLRWADLKQSPPERFDSPLVLLPVELTLKKGVRDTFWLQAAGSEAEVNPVVRHQFKRLYDVVLPEKIDLAETSVKAFYEYLASRVQASEPAINAKLIERPRIRLIHARAQRRLDLYRRRLRLTGRGVRSFLDLDYSYEPENYHPLGARLFNERIRPPGTRLRAILETTPRLRRYAAPETSDGRCPAAAPPADPEARPAPDAPASPVETFRDTAGAGDTATAERLMFTLEDEPDPNPYTWEFDLCGVTLGNFKYRKMSLVRDYSTLLESGAPNPAFDAVFSLAPRELGGDSAAAGPRENRFDIVDCDPTQAAAIAEARTGRSYVIQGPPGTGKSQTITNLITDYVARGRRVLFVCEKRAAIDVVFLRLRQRGLDALCALIHDSQADKKPFVMDLKQVYETLLDPSQVPDKSPEQKREQALNALRRELGPLEQFHEAMTRVPERSAAPVRSLMHRLVQLDGRAAALSPQEFERVPYYADWSAHRSQLARFSDAVSDVQPDGVLTRHPLRHLRAELVRAERPIERVTTGLSKARAALAEVAAALTATGLPSELCDTLEKARRLVDYAVSVEPLARRGHLALLDTRSEISKRLAKFAKQYRAASKAYERARQAASGWTVKIPPGDALLALAQAKRLEQTPLPMLKLSWWRLRRIINRSYNSQGSVVRPTWSQLFEQLEHEYQAAAALEALAARIGKEFGSGGPPAEFFKLVEQLRGESAQAAPDVAEFRERLLQPASCGDEVSAVIAAGPAIAKLQRELGTFFEHADRRTLDELQSDLAAIGESLDKLPDFLHCLAALADLPSGIAEAVRDLPLDSMTLEAAAARRSLDDALRDDRALARFSGATRDSHAARLDRCCRDWRAANAVAVFDRVRRRFLEHVGLASQPAAQLGQEQKEFKKTYNAGRRELEHEFSKSMRFKSIRDLAAGPSGAVIRDLKPVWLMSPLSVSDALPLEDDLFDVVIFDEASQITVEEAVPAIFRARQAIIVGDEMQLPPTDFFSARADGDGDDPLLVEEGDELIAYDLDRGSFLNHAIRNLAGRMLGWHYRSRSESLISFSNRAFYQGRLLTVPEQRIATAEQGELRIHSTTDADRFAASLLERPISFHYLAHALYDNRRNRPEADYIARLVRELLRHETRLSLGVIAFSEAQQDEITGALNRLAQSDADFARRLEAEYEREDDGQFHGLLVKNLENIQGDERDIVIQSVCYGRGPNGKMLMNFGPINRSGGEKRLNVAFTRAKRHMALVTSIQAADITNEYNDGANCLKNYLRYAAAVSAGDNAVANRVLAELCDWRGDDGSRGDEQDDAVVAQLAGELRSRGWLIDTDVGQSHFRCDLAVRRDEDRAYRLGILVDTDAYYRQRDVLERELMKPQLLDAFGWQVAHVLTKDWLEDRSKVIQRILRRLEGKNGPPPER